MDDKNQNNPKLSIFYITMGGALIAMTTLLAKALGTDSLGDPLHPLQISNARFLAAFIPILIITIIRKTKIESPRWHLHITRSISGWSAVSLLFAAVAIIPVSDATAITFLNPIFGMVFAIPILREKVGSKRWLAAIIGLVGSMILIRPTSASFQPAALLALISASIMGLELIIIKYLAKYESTLQILVINNAMGLFISTVAVLFVWEPPSLHQWSAMAALGILMAGGQVCNIKALRGADASFILPFSYSTLLFVTLYDFLIYSFKPDMTSYIGASVIMFSVAIMTWHQIKSSQKNPH